MSGALEGLGHRLGGRRLADAGLSLEQQRLPERGGEVERGGSALVDEVVHGVEPAHDVVRIDEGPAHGASSRARRAS